MSATIPWPFPPRHLGQINPIRFPWPTHIPGHGIQSPPRIGAVQLDGLEFSIVCDETYTGVFTDAIQLDSFQPVIIVVET